MWQVGLANLRGPVQNENVRLLVQNLLRTLRPWQQGIKPSVGLCKHLECFLGVILTAKYLHGPWCCRKKNDFLSQIILLNYVKWVSINIFTQKKKKKKKDGALQCSGLESLKPSLQWIQECCLAWAQHINSPPTAPSPQCLGMGGLGGTYIVSGSFLPGWEQGWEKRNAGRASALCALRRGPSGPTDGNVKHRVSVFISPRRHAAWLRPACNSTLGVLGGITGSPWQYLLHCCLGEL